MSITVECECGSQFRLADKAAGRTIRCKDCDEPIDVPKQRHKRNREDDEDEPGFDEATFESNSERHQVSMNASPAAAACLTAEMLEQTCEALVEYLDASPNVFKKSDLQLEVDIEVHTRFLHCAEQILNVGLWRLRNRQVIECEYASFVTIV